MSEKKLRYADLSQRHPGVTHAIGAAYAEAAQVCLSKHHASPKDFDVHDVVGSMTGTAEWQSVDDKTKGAWANDEDATEAGAYCLALAAVELTRNVVAVRRAETRTGADYYLGAPGELADDLETSLRLEVSGTSAGNHTAIQARLRQKLGQAAKGRSNLPAIATVVGFSALTIVTADVDVP